MTKSASIGSANRYNEPVEKSFPKMEAGKCAWRKRIWIGPTWRSVIQDGLQHSLFLEERAWDQGRLTQDETLDLHIAPPPACTTGRSALKVSRRSRRVAAKRSFSGWMRTPAAWRSCERFTCPRCRRSCSARPCTASSMPTGGSSRRTARRQPAHPPHCDRHRAADWGAPRPSTSSWYW